MLGRRVKALGIVRSHVHRGLVSSSLAMHHTSMRSLVLVRRVLLLSVRRLALPLVVYILALLVR